MDIDNDQTSIEDAARLLEIFKRRQSVDPSLTQHSLAKLCGWKYQSAAQQYLNGSIPLNLDALIKFSEFLCVSPSEISPSLARLLLRAANKESAHLEAEIAALKHDIDQLHRIAADEATAHTEALGKLAQQERLNADYVHIIKEHQQRIAFMEHQRSIQHYQKSAMEKK